MSYSSRTLTAAETKRSSNYLECLVVVWVVEKLRPYLYGKKAKIRTDSKVARALMTRRDLTGKDARWTEKLAELASGLTFEHCLGSQNAVADTLSRVGLAITSPSP